MRNGWLVAVVIAAVVSFPAPYGAGERGTGFSFPADKAGQLLERLLRPGEKAGAAADAAGRHAQRPADALDKLELPLPPLTVESPRAKQESVGQAKPRPLGEGQPLAGQRHDPLRPGTVALPPGARVRLPSFDVNEPIPLPLLGVAQPDRAPLSDPTTAASLAAALAGFIPERTAPAAFLRLSVPDPFENSHVVRVRTPLSENPAPPTAEPRRPGR